MITTKCVHNKKESYDVYIGRPSKFGNPFPLKKGATDEERTKAVEEYEQWLRTKPELIEAAKKELRGKVIGCWCAPKQCHGDILIKVIHENDED